MLTYLILQVVEEVGPGLLDTTLLLDDGLLDDTRQDAERHGDTVVVVAVNRGASLERLLILAEDDDPVVKLVGLNTKLGCVLVGLDHYRPLLTELVSHGLDTVALFHSLIGNPVDPRALLLETLDLSPGSARLIGNRSED